MLRAVKDSPVRPAGPSRSMALAFECYWTDDGLDAAWVQAVGELDLASAPRLALAISEALAAARLVVLDLRELVFIDVAGMRTIVNASDRARRHTRRMILLRGPANVDRVFALTGASDHVDALDLAKGDSWIHDLLESPSAAAG